MIASPVKYTSAVRHEFLKQAVLVYSGTKRRMESTHTEVGALRFEQSSPITPRERTVDEELTFALPAAELSLRQRGCDPPRRLHNHRELPKVRPACRPIVCDPWQAMPRLGVFGRRRRRSKATRPGHPCTRVKERRGHKSRVHLVHPPRPPRPRDKETLRFLVHPRLRRFANIFRFRSVWREESLFWNVDGQMDGWIKGFVVAVVFRNKNNIFRCGVCNW